MNLADPITTLPGVGESYRKKLEKLGIFTVHDLLYHIPHRYLDFRQISPINQIEIDETYTLTGTILDITNTYTRKGKKITQATLSDSTGSIKLIWFNQTYLTKVIRSGDTLRVSGKISWWTRQKAMIAPIWKKTEETDVPVGEILTIYPETEGITSTWLSKLITHAWQEVKENVVDTLPQHIRDQYELQSLHEAIEFLHLPTDIVLTEKARYRLAFEELYFLMQNTKKQRETWNAYPVLFTHNPVINGQNIVEFIAQLPFTLTDAQHRAVKHILGDLEKEQPMRRLLQGDVGAGKTIVAAIAAYAGYLVHNKTVLLAPTEVLAKQHFDSFSTLFTQYGVELSLVTGSVKTDDFHEKDIIIGTHALFNQKKLLENTGLIIIDEQHKFGVDQQNTLLSSKIKPHVLTMTATPIPRSIAMTIYGDQDLTLLDELPKGRLPVKTWVIPENKRSDSYTWIKQHLSEDSNHQAVFVIPLIEESEHETMSDVKAVTKEFETLQNIFSTQTVEMVHGKLPAKQKNNIVERFRGGEIVILVTTSVVEVGIDAPNASIIVIENAERFGLATLHQLRGRVGRSGQQAYCFLFTPSQDDLTLQRLKALETHHNGLTLAEIDLELRGPGQVFGTQQHGIGELRFAKITDLPLINTVKDALEDT